MGVNLEIAKSDNDIIETATDEAFVSDMKRVKAQLSELINERVQALGMGQSAFAVTARMNLHDLPDLLSGNDSEITIEHLREALETLMLADSVREIVSLVTDIPRSDVNRDDDHSGITPEPQQNCIGKTINSRRRQLRMSQSELATKMGVSTGLISHWERGKTRLVVDDLFRLASFLATTPAALVSEADLGTLKPEEALHSRDEASRSEHHEQMLLRAFRRMTDEQKALALRLIDAVQS